MIARRTKQSSVTLLRRYAIAAMLLVLAVLTGCRSFSDSIKGDNFADEFAHWGEKQRAPTSPGQLWSLSEQGQQVERNLGVR